MSLIKLIARLLLLAGLLLVGRTAIAGPLHCAYGNQDSTCVPTISAGWQTPPTCSSAAGWTTIAGATWIGSQYTAPQCNYQAPPTCPAGYAETSAPGWTGSSWTAPGCAAPPPELPVGWTTTGLLGACEVAINGRQPSGAWQPYTPPVSSVGGWQYISNYVYYWVAEGLQNTYIPVQYDTYFELYLPSSNFQMYNYIGGDYQVLGMVVPAGSSTPTMWSCDITPSGTVQSVVPFTPPYQECSAYVTCGSGYGGSD